MFGGTTRRFDICHPAWSRSRTAWWPGATFCGNFGQVEVHCLGIAARHDESCTLAFLGADGAEDVGRGGALIVWRGGPGAALAQRRVILFFWPMRASSANQTSIAAGSMPFSLRDFVQARGEFYGMARPSVRRCNLAGRNKRRMES